MTENEWSKEISGAAIEVHRNLGPGLPESAFEEALCYDLKLREIRFERQNDQAQNDKSKIRKTDYRIKLPVAEKVIIEIKAKETVSRLDKAQTPTSPRGSDLKPAVLINFHEPLLKDGLSRRINNL